MALDDILQAIERDAATRVREIEGGAERRSRALLEHARAEAARRRESAAHAMDARTARDVDRIVNQARLAADRALRKARDSLYTEARDAMLRRLGEQRCAPTYPALLERLLVECLAVLPTARFVRCDPRDTELVEIILQKTRRPELSVQPELSTIGGLDVSTNDGRTIRNTFEARLVKAEDHLRQLAGEVLPVLRSGPP